MGAKLQAEIVAAAATLAKDKQTPKKGSALVGFEAALKEREETFGAGRDAVSYFVFTDQAKYHGGACQGSSDREDKDDWKADYESDCEAEDDAGRAVLSGGLKRAGAFADSSDEDGEDEDGSSLGSFIDDGDADGTGEDGSDEDCSQESDEDSRNLVSVAK